MSIEQEIIAQKLTEYVREEKDKTAGYGYFKQTLGALQAQSDNTFNRPVASSIPGLGGLVVLFKKAIRRMVAWYANPFAGQQAAFNVSAVETTAWLGETVNALQQENRVLQERLEKLEAQVWQLQNGGE